jgi:hypothetical protein
LYVEVEERQKERERRSELIAGLDTKTKKLYERQVSHILIVKN